MTMYYIHVVLRVYWDNSFIHCILLKLMGRLNLVISQVVIHLSDCLPQKQGLIKIV